MAENIWAALSQQLGDTTVPKPQSFRNPKTEQFFSTTDHVALELQ